VRLAHRPEHQLVGLRVAVQPQRRIARTSRLRFFARASSSERVFATTAIGSSGSGISHGDISSGSSFDEIVSPVSAVPDLVIAQMSPAMHSEISRSAEPSGE